MPTQYRVVYVTVPSKKEAQGLTRALLEAKVAACVNIIPKVESHYWWEGKIDSSDEFLLIVKTRASLMVNVMQIVRELHSYEVPEIVSLPIMEGNQAYLDWLGASTNTAKPMKDLPREELDREPS